MRSSTISNLALLASSLLVGDALAVPYEKRQGNTVVTVTEGAGGPAPTASPSSSTSPQDPGTTSAPSPSTGNGTSSTGSGLSSKRGLSYNDASLLQGFTGGDASWCYNWDSTAGNIPQGLNYAPMLHDLDPQNVGDWKSNAEAAIKAGATHLQYVNEPDVDVAKGGTNIAVALAAASFTNMMQIKTENPNIKIGSPAVSNGVSGGPQGDMGIPYIQKFWDACTNCQFDFVAFHWYGDTLDELQAQVKAFYNAAKAEPKVVKDANGDPTLWLTEFGINSGQGNPSAIQNFLVQDGTLDWLDQQSYLERYAYQWVADQFLVTGTQINAAGKAYISS